MIIKKPDIMPHCPARIVFVGRLSEEKGLKILFQSIVEVKKDIAIELLIIGEGSQESYLRSQAKTLGIADNIKWFGSLRWGPRLFGKIAEADTLVLPSYSEGLPLVTIEGMSQGLVVVASSVGGIPEILDNGRCGILVTPGDAKELADALKLSVTDIGLRRRLIVRGLEQAKKHCLEEQAGLLVKEIRRLVENRQGCNRAYSNNICSVSQTDLGSEDGKGKNIS
jgi:glycosyltransferase involved in cell wall biosynthesis